MVATIAGLLFLIVGLSIGFIMKRESSRPGRAAIPIAAGIIVAVILIGGACFTSVPTGHTGVVTTFGRVEDFTLDAGIHGKLPWQDVIMMDTGCRRRASRFPAFRPISRK